MVWLGPVAFLGVLTCVPSGVMDRCRSDEPVNSVNAVANCTIFGYLKGALIADAVVWCASHSGLVWQGERETEAERHVAERQREIHTEAERQRETHTEADTEAEAQRARCRVINS